MTVGKLDEHMLEEFMSLWDIRNDDNRKTAQSNRTTTAAQSNNRRESSSFKKRITTKKNHTQSESISNATHDDARTITPHLNVCPTHEAPGLKGVKGVKGFIYERAAHEGGSPSVEEK